MKKIYIIILFLCLTDFSFSQQKENITGKVSYISSQFTYIKFSSTNGIKVNDTLFVKRRKKYIPKLIVNSLSSHSAAAKVIGKNIKKGRTVYAFIKRTKNVLVTTNEPKNKLLKYNKAKNNKKSFRIKNRRTKRRNIRGKFSISGYSNLTNINTFTNYQNWRYSFSLEANRINNSRFSFSNYIVFRYRADQWHLLSDNIGKALKVYKLAGRYDFNKRTKLVFGRKINRNLSNVGAIDGFQLETKLNKFRLGGIIGSRPDYNDYGFNLKLFQFGAYVTRKDSLAKGVMRNTLSLFQQMNNGATDRRFIYFQHSNDILPKISFFFSSELDLFQKVNGKPLNSLRLTSIYFSARYSPSRWISFSSSYDARKNVIYYETFKNYAARLLNEALRQGFRFRINLRPIRYVYASIYSGYRFRENDIRPTKNFGGSITHSRVPYLNVSANINFINLNTNYLNGNVLGFRLTKSFMNGILTTSINYKNVNYKFLNNKNILLQNIFSTDFYLRISQTISLSVSFEGTYREKESYSNIYLNLTTRF